METDKVSIEPLDVNNYAVWAARMEALLDAKGLWGAISHPETATDAIKRKAKAELVLRVKDHHLVTIVEGRLVYPVTAICTRMHPDTSGMFYSLL